jgi:methionyl-tRNA formyltransferase
LVFAGTPAPALPSLRALLDSPRHEVVAVVTRPDKPAGRGRHVAGSPVRALAEEAGVEVLAPSRPREPDFLERLAAIGPDCAPVVAYGALVPPAALAIPRHGWVNLHFSLLPAWRGAAPVQHAVLAGDEVTGATTFQLEEGLDTGPVYGTVTEQVRPSDTAGDLVERLARSGADLLVATLDGIEDGTLEARAQPEDGVTFAPRIEVADARVDWTLPAVGVDRLLRAVTPAPGGWTTLRGRRLKLGPLAVPAPAGRTAAPAAPAASGGALEKLAPGQVADLGPDGVFAGTATGPVRLGTVQPEGRPAMPAEAWARGVRLGDDDHFD